MLQERRGLTTFPVGLIPDLLVRYYNDWTSRSNGIRPIRPSYLIKCYVAIRSEIALQPKGIGTELRVT